jgi:hypothetical protein
MRNRRLTTLLLVVTFGVAQASYQIVAAAQKTTEPAVIPFEVVNRHIMIKVSINKSAPLWFIFDTGDKVAIVDSTRARALGLNLQGEINVGGAGEGSLKGSFVRDASLNVVDVEGHQQPVALAVPLSLMAPNFGHDVDGIIGADFIKEFVVEIDYEARVMRLHNKERFVYSGPGEVLPVSFINGGHPTIPAEITAPGRQPLKGKFVIDVGSGGSLMLNRPFVEQENLLAATPKTIRLMGAGGAGGKATGRVGRLTRLRIGKLEIDDPVTAFSEDKGGAFGNSQTQGNIGHQILSKFKIFLDYGRERMILEPNASFKKPIGPASTGLAIVGEGSDYKTFRVIDLLEDSPAAEAGLKAGDVLISVDGHPATELTLTILHELFEKPTPRKLSVRRGEQTLEITVTPRRLI